MNNKWFLLLMTPLFTYANYENNGWDDLELYNETVVVEEEAPFIDEQAELLVEASYDDVNLLDEFEEELEALTKPVASVGAQERKGSSKSALSRPPKRYKDIRQRSNRPKVTHRESAEQQTESKGNAQPKRFVFQEDQSEAKVDRQQSFDREASVAESQPQFEDSFEQQEIRRQPTRQAGQRRATRKHAPVAERQAQVEERTEQREVRRQPTRQASQRRAVHKEAPVAERQAQVEERTEQKEVRRQPTRQASQRRAVRKDAPVAERQAQVEERSEQREVRRQPERHAGQRRAVSKDAPVAKQQAGREKSAPQKQMRSAGQQKMTGRGGQAALSSKRGKVSQGQQAKKEQKQRESRWALPPQEKAQASVAEEKLKPKDPVSAKNRQQSTMRSTSTERKGVVQQRRARLADSRVGKVADLEESQSQRSSSVGSAESHSYQVEKARQPKGRGPKSHHSGKRPQS